MIDFSTMENALRAWVTAAVPTISVVWAEQNAPRPARPYIAIRHSDLVRVGDDVSGLSATSGGVVNMTGTRELTFSVQSYGPGARSILEAVNSATQKETTKAINRAAGLVFVRNLGPVQNIAEVLDLTDFEERAAVDFLFRIAQTYTDTVGAIDSATIRPVLRASNSDIIVNDPYTITQI